MLINPTACDPPWVWRGVIFWLGEGYMTTVLSYDYYYRNEIHPIHKKRYEIQHGLQMLHPVNKSVVVLFPYYLLIFLSPRSTGTLWFFLLTFIWTLRSRWTHESNSKTASRTVTWSQSRSSDGGWRFFCRCVNYGLWGLSVVTIFRASDQNPP